MFHTVSRWTLAASALLAVPALAASPFTGKTGKLTVDVTSGETTFTFDGPAAVGQIKGLASGASGQFTIGDAADLATTKGSVKVAVKDMKTGNPTRDQEIWNRMAKPGAPGELIISWPVGNLGFGVQAAPVALPGAWLGSALNITVVGGQYVVTIPISGSSGFFRLAR